MTNKSMFITPPGASSTRRVSAPTAPKPKVYVVDASCSAAELRASFLRDIAQFGYVEELTSLDIA